MKIAIIQTHPIQHFCPQFASYANIREAEIKVFFETDKGIKPYYDQQFKREIKWEGIDLDSFNHCFLNGNKIENLLNDFNPEAVIIYGYTKKIQKNAKKWGQKNNKRLIYISDTENHQKRNALKQLIKRIVLKNYFSKINLFLSVGDANEDFYKWCGVKKTKMIRMFFPIDIQLLNNIAQERHKHSEFITKKYNITADELIITTIGKLVSWKSQQNIINLLFHLENESIPCVAFILGSGPDLAMLKEESRNLTKNRAIFPGFVQPREMMSYLCATSIYVHPAKIEPHSLAISEAIYLGCPAIISDSCGSYGPTDDVQHGKNGFVYPTGNIKVLAHKIRYLYENPEVRETFAIASMGIGRHNQKLAHGEALRAAINLILSE